MTVTILEGSDDPAPTPVPAPVTPGYVSTPPTVTGSSSSPSTASPAASAGAPAGGTFTQKLISVQFNLATGAFQGGGNTATVSGLRVSCHIVNQGGPAMSNLELAIYGLPLSMMNQLATLGKSFNRFGHNGIAVQAGDASGMNLVFEGNIFDAFVDAQAMPQVCFRVLANMGAYHAVKPVAPISQAGSVKATTLMSKLAQQMGLQFEDAGVTAVLSNPYYPGTAWTQMLQIAKHGGFNVAVDKGTMAIMPAGTPRQGGAVLISPQTGLRGYPRFSSNSVVVEAVYNPALKFMGSMQVQSDLTSACGVWLVNRLEYDLESMVPHGKWFMTANGISPGPTPA